MSPELATIAQLGLLHEGFNPGPADGVWGQRTEGAFQRWQTSYFAKRPAPADAPPWLAIARKEIGVSEIAGPSHNPRIVEYHQRTKLKAKDDETAWCSSFACWVLEEAGLPSPRSAWAKDWLKWGVPGEMRVGAIVVFKRGTNYGHVGFAEKWDAKTIHVLGGNQSNRVNIAPQPRSLLLGIRWPA